MTSKERVLRTFGKLPGKADKIPLQFDLCRSLTDYFATKYNMEAEYTLSYYEDLTYRISANAIRTKMGSDCVVVGGSVAEDFKAKEFPDGTALNEFGMKMRPTSLYVEVVECPLKDVETEEDLAKYNFPDAYAKGRFEDAKRDIKRFGKEYFVIGDVELSLFELAWHLVGMEKYLIELAMGSPWIAKLNDMVEEWTTGLALSLIDLGVDAIWLGEDLGTQISMLISPDMWREHFKFRYERMIKKMKGANPDLLVIFHSDGAVAPLIDDFIEIGVDIYNPVQPNVPGSDPQELMDKYAGRINFFGGIDQQELLPSGNFEAIKEEIERRKNIMGKDGGYLMAPAHIIQADVEPETVEFMCSLFKE
ncbi:MAG: uroporphyrinogen decarboxylase family protein [Sphaerochaetaceae bacterium]